MCPIENIPARASSYHNSVILGGAQLGLRYGVCHSRFLSRVQLYELLDKAYYLGFRSWDLAQAYGCAEARMGQWLRRRRLNISSSRTDLRIGTKLLPGRASVLNKQLWRSRSGLASPGQSLSYVLLHGYDGQKLTEQLNALQRASCKQSGHKESGEKTGISLYYPHELETILKQIERGDCPAIDIVQLPYSIADRRFVPYFPLLREQGITIQLRSLYLQGLLLDSANALRQSRPAYFQPLLPLLQGMEQLEVQLAQVDLSVSRQDILLFAGLLSLEQAEAQNGVEAKSKMQLVLGASSAQEVLQLHHSLHRLAQRHQAGKFLQLQAGLQLLSQQVVELAEEILVPALWRYR